MTGQRIRDGGRLHAGLRLDALRQRFPEAALVRPLRVRVGRQPDARRHDVGGFDAELAARGAQDALRHERGQAKQQACERDLEYDEAPGNPSDREARAHPAAVAQERIERRARCAPGRREACEQRRGECRGDCDDRHAIVDVERPPPRAVLQHALDDELDAVERNGSKQQPEHGRKRADHEAFRQHVCDEAAAGGAKGRADGRLAHAVGGAREQQVRDVRAGDQQHEADRDQHGPDELRVIADPVCGERLQLEAAAEGIRADFRLDLRGDRRKLLLRDVDVAVLLEAPEDIEVHCVLPA